VTSPVTEPRVWTLNGEWNEAAAADGVTESVPTQSAACGSW